MGEGIDGTRMRELVANDKREMFLSHVPPHLSDSEKDRVWDIVSSEKKTIVPSGVGSSPGNLFTEMMYRMIEEELTVQQRQIKVSKSKADNLYAVDEASCSKTKKKKRKNLKEDELEEISTVAGGFEMSAAKSKQPNDDDDENPSIIREDEEEIV